MPSTFASPSTRMIMREWPCLRPEMDWRTQRPCTRRLGPLRGGGIWLLKRKMMISRKKVKSLKMSRCKSNKLRLKRQHKKTQLTFLLHLPTTSQETPLSLFVSFLHLNLIQTLKSIATSLYGEAFSLWLSLCSLWGRVKT